jgi:hypothetical protein
MSDQPTPEEIARVRAYEKQQMDEHARKRREEREAKIAAQIERITHALIDERITEVEIEDIDEYGEIYGDGEFTLKFASGRALTIKLGGWETRYIDIQIADAP